MSENCTQCGKCCLHMKRYIVIDSSIGQSTHYCRCTLTKENFIVRLFGDDMRRFSDKSGLDKMPDACPFLRAGEPDVFICTAYSSRPGHCMNFFCHPKD